MKSSFRFLSLVLAGALSACFSAAADLFESVKLAVGFAIKAAGDLNPVPIVTLAQHQADLLKQSIPLVRMRSFYESLIQRAPNKYSTSFEFGMSLTT